jgi:hypothetical protein
MKYLSANQWARTIISGITCILFSIGHAIATTQEKDLIIVEGHRYYTDEYPSLKEAFPDTKLPDFVMLHTANYKGYRATWAIVDGQLLLIGVEGKIKGDDSHRLHRSKELFPKITFPYRVTSFSGILELKGGSDDYVIEGQLIHTTKSVKITLKEGKVTSTKNETSTTKR